MYGNNSGLFDDLKYQFKYGGVLTQLILLNVGVWIFMLIFKILNGIFLKSILGFDVFAKIYSFIAIPSNIVDLLYRFWTPFTYMFAHSLINPFHIIFNMLWLWWFGRIFTVFLDVKKTLPIYILGGLAGALLYLLCYNLIPVLQPIHTTMVGASASVMAIVFATTTLSPNYEIRLFLLGDVKIKYIAAVAFIFDLVTIAAIDNANVAEANIGGALAHIGGAFMGFFLMKQLQNGNDFISPVNKFFDRISGKRHPKPRVVYRKRESVTTSEKKRFSDTVIANINRRQEQSNLDPNSMTLDEKRDKVDEILDKIKEKGYDNISKEEREFLFTYSNES